MYMHFYISVLISTLCGTCLCEITVAREDVGDRFNRNDCSTYAAKLDGVKNECVCENSNGEYGTFLSRNIGDKQKCFYDGEDATGCNLRFHQSAVLNFIREPGDIEDRDMSRDTTNILNDGIDCTKFEITQTEIWQYDKWKTFPDLLLTNTNVAKRYRIKWKQTPDRTLWERDFKGYVFRVNTSCTLVKDRKSTITDECFAFKIIGSRTYPPSPPIDIPTTNPPITTEIPITNPPIITERPTTKQRPVTTVVTTKFPGPITVPFTAITTTAKVDKTTDTTTSTTTQASTASPSKTDNTPAIIGGVFGTVAILFLLFTLVYFLYRRRKKNEQLENRNYDNKGKHGTLTMTRSVPNDYQKPRILSPQSHQPVNSQSDYLSPQEMGNSTFYDVAHEPSTPVKRSSILNRMKNSFHGKMQQYRLEAPIAAPRPTSNSTSAYTINNMGNKDQHFDKTHNDDHQSKHNNPHQSNKKLRTEEPPYQSRQNNSYKSKQRNTENYSSGQNRKQNPRDKPVEDPYHKGKTKIHNETPMIVENPYITKSKNTNDGRHNNNQRNPNNLNLPNKKHEPIYQELSDNKYGANVTPQINIINAPRSQHIQHEPIYAMPPKSPMIPIKKSKPVKDKLSNKSNKSYIYDLPQQSPSIKRVKQTLQPSRSNEGSINSGWGENEFDTDDDENVDVATIRRPQGAHVIYESSQGYNHHNNTNNNDMRTQRALTQPEQTTPGYKGLNSTRRHTEAYAELKRY